MAGDLRVEVSPVGPVVRPPDPAEMVILYLHGDRYLSGTPTCTATGTSRAPRSQRSAGPAKLRKPAYSRPPAGPTAVPRDSHSMIVVDRCRQ
jgi:hypothetical protein